MEQSQLAWIANFIWGIADDVLRDLYVRGKYRNVILPMTVLAPEALGGPAGAVVEYEPDPDLRDTEPIPFLEEGGIEAFLRREVLPYAPDAPDAWYDPGSVKMGYEISSTRYFYKPKPLHTLDEIRADRFALEKQTEGLLEGILRDAQGEQ
jgi:type I restriction enzyme M protein